MANALKELDLVFAMDCTGSMGSYIEQAKQNIRKIVDDIISKENADIRLALVEYRDHPPQDSSFVTRVLEFTSSIREMKARLEQCQAQGGGDAPEAVADALHALLKLEWREKAAKICVFISDAPPHALGEQGDAFPNECPCGLDPMATTDQIADKGITMYMVGCEPAIMKYRDWFMAIAHKTGGQYVPLRSAKLLPEVIIGGAQEELSLQRLMDDVNLGIQEELAAVPDGTVAEEDVERMVHQRMTSRSVTSKKLVSDQGDLPDFSKLSKDMSACSNMKDARVKFLPEVNSRGSDYYNRIASEPVESSYSTVETGITYSQCARMAQKSLNSCNAVLKSKVKPRKEPPSE